VLQLYPDDNHKPEMALAISDGFEALCSFRQVSKDQTGKEEGT